MSEEMNKELEGQVTAQEVAPEEAAAEKVTAEEPVETMEDFAAELEASYQTLNKRKIELAEEESGAGAKWAQFQQMMNLIIGRALEVNNEKLSQDISCLVKERLAGEMELLLKDSDQKEEERFRLLDETIRSFQKSGQEEAAAAKVPFFKKKRFGRGAKKLFHREKRS